MKAYTILLGGALGLGAISLLVGCENPVGLDDQQIIGEEIPHQQTTLVLSPAAPEIEVDEVVRFEVTLKGEAVDVQDVAWLTSNPERAIIVAPGEVLGVSAGPSVITAKRPGASGQVTLTVVRGTLTYDERPEKPMDDDLQK